MITSNNKPTINWVNFLHIYQPPWQQHDVITRVSQQSYQNIISTLQKFPNYKITLNISGSLTEQLLFFGLKKVLDNFNELAKRGQIEFVGSAKYHPILPLISAKQVIRQIQENEIINKKYLYKFKPRGFYLPEMAYSDNVAKIIKKLGYQWIILDEISTNQKLQPTSKYSIKNIGLDVIFRNSQVSRGFPPEEIYKLAQAGQIGDIITATDGELYGHHHQDWQDHLKQLLEKPIVKCWTVSSYLQKLNNIQPLTLRKSNWESTEKQLQSNKPYLLWSNKNNKAHRLAWTLADYATVAIEGNKNDPNLFWAQHHLDRGLSSCSFWWASEIKTSAFSPLSWNPDEVDNGLEELIRSLRSLNNLSKDKKIIAEKLYIAAKKEVWTRHWRKHHDNQK